jgi:hypothetical protein
MPSLSARILNLTCLVLLVGWTLYAAAGTNLFGERPWPNSVDYGILYDNGRRIVEDGRYGHGVFPYPSRPRSRWPPAHARRPGRSEWGAAPRRRSGRGQARHARISPFRCRPVTATASSNSRLFSGRLAVTYRSRIRARYSRCASGPTPVPSLLTLVSVTGVLARRILAR